MGRECRGVTLPHSLPVFVLTGPTGAGKSDWADASRRSSPGRDRQRGLRAGLSWHGHRHRKADRELRATHCRIT